MSKNTVLTLALAAKRIMVSPVAKGANQGCQAKTVVRKRRLLGTEEASANHGEPDMRRPCDLKVGSHEDAVSVQLQYHTAARCPAWDHDQKKKEKS